MDSPVSASDPLLAGPLQQLLEMGGPVMVVLLALAVVGLVTFFYLMLVGALYAPGVNRELRTAITGWRQQPGQQWPAQLARGRGRWLGHNPLRSMVGDTMTACLEGQDATNLREELARRAQKAVQPFEAPLKIIEVIAALAPLLGLLGTVMGMMEAFGAMAATEGRASATQLSGGIYEALTTTAAGLVLAIPFAAIAAWVEFRLRRINSRMNDALVQVISAPAVSAGSPQIKVDDSAVSPAPESRYTKPRVAHAAG